MMNKKIVLTALFTVLLSSVSFAQRAYKEGNAVIINCYEMDSKLFNPNRKSRFTTADNYNLGKYEDSEISSIASNDKIYPIFEVGNSNGEETWIGAINACNNITGIDVNGIPVYWRLPTQRELILIWLFKYKLKDLGLVDFIGEEYWCATQGDATTAYVVNFSNYWYATDKSLGSSYYIPDNKKERKKYRCVRDIVF